MGQSTPFFTATVLDVQHAESRTAKGEIGYSVVVDSAEGFEIFEVDQSRLRALGIMDAFISGASMQLPSDQVRMPLGD